jgi:hexosaminidase
VYIIVLANPPRFPSFVTFPQPHIFNNINPTAKMGASFYVLVTFFSLQVLAVWPAPKSFESGNSVLWIEPNVEVTYNGGSVCRNSSCILLDSPLLTEQSPLQSSYSASGNGGFSSKIVVQDAVTRAFAILFTQSLVPWKLVPRDGLSKFEASPAYQTYISSLTITQFGNDSYNPAARQVDESYNLTISKDGEAEIVAASPNGCLHALQTFIQLFYQHSTGAGMYTNLAPVTIIDAPKFQHRALNMDVSRNWYPVCIFPIFIMQEWR